MSPLRIHLINEYWRDKLYLGYPIPALRIDFDMANLDFQYYLHLPF